MSHPTLVLSLVALSALGSESPAGSKASVVSGELKQWHAVTITFTGPESSETAAPNPFRDYRLNVRFTNGETSHTVAGFFAADGNAAETGAERGDKWCVRFTPDCTGEWRYQASFRTGKDVALSLDPDAGRPTAFDGAGGSFRVGPTDKAGRDHRGKGLLRYVGGHHLQFSQTREFFLKGGADSPENFLAYADFDGTRSLPSGKRRRPGEADRLGLHNYKPHLRDWRPGDPTWQGGKGKGIIGALNYLAGKGMNSVYFLTMNVGGDGKDVWPWIGDRDRDRFDCSKLDQWEIVFSHMDRLGIMLHVITQETENDQLLDGGELGAERKLYYRELIARFGHHLAVTWNLGEENTNTDEQRKSFARYIHDLDPYDHPVVVHTFPNKQNSVYEPLLGYEYFEGVSLQTNQTRAQTILWVERSASAGRKWIVSLDEIGPAHTGVKPDADDFQHDAVRKEHLWGNLMSGGAGVEWYFGYKYPHNDLNCEDWRSRDHLWDLTRYALDFFQQHLPFVEMRRADLLTSARDDYCLAKPGAVYAIYLLSGGETKLNLGRMEVPFVVKWYNPRSGGALVDGTVKTVRGPGEQSIGKPPADHDKDWVALIETQTKTPLCSVQVNGGSGGGRYPPGTAVNIAADWQPNGREFDKWMPTEAGIVADVRESSTILIMPSSDTEVTACYKPKPPTPVVTDFTLINAETDKPISGFDPLKDGATIDLAKLPTSRLNIRANVSGTNVERVRFSFAGQDDFRTEKSAPYSLAGDSDGRYNSLNLSIGKHTLSATVLSRSNTGKPSKSSTITFTVVDKQ